MIRKLVSFLCRCRVISRPARKVKGNDYQATFWSDKYAVVAGSPTSSVPVDSPDRYELNIIFVSRQLKGIILFRQGY